MTQHEHFTQTARTLQGIMDRAGMRVEAARAADAALLAEAVGLLQRASEASYLARYEQSDLEGEIRDFLRRAGVQNG